jgi:hypothetical protein
MNKRDRDWETRDAYLDLCTRKIDSQWHDTSHPCAYFVFAIEEDLWS